MPSRDTPLRFIPTSLADTLLGDNVEPGKCAALTNLIFDPATPGAFICRPAAYQLVDFTGDSISPSLPG